MHKTDNLYINPDVASSLINQVGGIAGQLISERNAGKQISNASQELAKLSEQTLAALQLAQQQAANQPKQTNLNPLVIGGVGLVIVVLIFFIFKK